MTNWGLLFCTSSRPPAPPTSRSEQQANQSTKFQTICTSNIHFWTTSKSISKVPDHLHHQYPVLNNKQINQQSSRPPAPPISSSEQQATQSTKFQTTCTTNIQFWTTSYTISKVPDHLHHQYPVLNSKANQLTKFQTTCTSSSNIQFWTTSKSINNVPDHLHLQYPVLNNKQINQPSSRSLAPLNFYCMYDSYHRVKGTVLGDLYS